ncbi:YiaA/YiaB family inner membrane protein [Pseudoruegeria sp. HB172150]|uniref:YiaA/YiaB family inner membrane protein n=1 Tax=Pseudoruegeria sp. HB172150 TaxID=2721164 RepID=UPI00155197B9|nr:YiaA/YiaB family inner membrane protein [Pseudoruegeria sp. HB172150]
MSDQTTKPRAQRSNAYELFTYLQFAIAAFMMAAGIYNLQATLTAKGYYAMAAIMLVSTAVTITNSVRDREETKRLHNAIEEARTNRLLRESGD